jgi:integrase
MVRKTTRRRKRVWVLDFTFTKPDGTQGRYRRDAIVQSREAAQTELAARQMGATLFGNPEILCGSNGQPLTPAEPALAPPPTEEATFAETVHRYITEYAPSALSPSTADDYCKSLKLRFVPRLGKLPVSRAFEVSRSREIDVAMVETGLSASRRRNSLLALRSVGRYAVEANLLPHMPTFLALPKRGKSVPSAPPAGDVALVIDAASCPEHELVLLLAADGGLRRGEIRALRCGDCEINNDRTVVRRSRYRNIDKSTKSGDERGVPMTARLRRALLAAGVDKRSRDAFAALSTRGKHWGTSGPYRVLQATLKRMNLPPVRLHALRAYFVTTLLNGHVPTHVVRELVGHGDLATTQRYAAIVESDRGAAVGVLDRAYQNARIGGPQGVGASADRSTRVRPMRRVSRVTARIRELRRRVMRRRSAGNNLETRREAAA